ncbi:MAG: type II toxin-antitoxin system RelE family toxin [Myxococcota bacterium]
MYSVVFADEALEDLKMLRPFDQARILDEIEEKLSSEPHVPSKLRKELAGLVPPWHHVSPVWQLRVGEYRVFYDVDDEEMEVLVRAIRRKGKKTTEEVL